MRERLAIDALWHVGLVEAPVARFLDPSFVPAIAWLPVPPAHLYYADPCVLDPRRESLRLLCEAYDYGTRRGRLVELALDDGRWRTRTVHAPAHHVSFPCVLEHAGERFCVAEQGATGETLLHRFDEAAGRLVEPRTLIAGFGASDPIVFEHAGSWFLLATDHAALPRHVLRVFHARAALGPYVPLAGPQLDAGPELVRAAGLPFRVDGKLYRPVQDTRVRYGGGLAITELVACTPERFEERLVRTLAPSDPRYRLGLHTLAVAKDLCVVDGLRPSRVPPVLRAGASLLANARARWGR